MNQADKKALLYYFSLTLALVFILYPLPKTFRETRLRSEFNEMHAAATVAARWYQIVDSVKREAGIPATGNGTLYDALLGLDSSSITTSPATLDAKKVTLNPDWAALIYLWLKKSGVKDGAVVGITVSGSFPALNIAALAAVKQAGAKAVLLSSLGSSPYGANDPRFTWLDIETALRARGGSSVTSTVVTPGGEGDRAAGLSAEAFQALRLAAGRNNAALFIPESFAASREVKKAVLDSIGMAAFINVGGNQVSIGKCAHAPDLPGGLLTRENGCMDSNNGLVAHYASIGLPVINLWNVKDVAVKNGVGGRLNYRPFAALYYETALKKWLVALTLFLYIIFLAVIRWRLRAE